MSTLSFKRAVEAALTHAGFFKSGNVWRFDGADVSLIVNLQKIEYSRQMFVNVGFWLKGLGANPPEKVELTHMYYRLERLCPEQREAILTAGDEGAQGHEHRSHEISAILANECFPKLQSLASLEAIRTRFIAGKLSGGLVQKEARQLLEAK